MEEMLYIYCNPFNADDSSQCLNYLGDSTDVMTK